MQHKCPQQQNKQPGRRRGRPTRSPPPTQPRPEEPCGKPGNNQDTPEPELTVEPREEIDGLMRREETTGAEAGDDVTVEKEIPQLTSEAQSRTAEDEIDVETVSQTGAGDGPQSEEPAEKPPYDDGATESSDETIDVEDCCQKDEDNSRYHSRAAPVTPLRLGSTGSCDQDEDVDVIGASSPAPVPVVINWPKLSEGEKEEEDEEVEVV